MLNTFINWQNFKLDKLFKVSGVGSISIEDIKLKYGVGSYPYITRTEKNNGIIGFYDYTLAPENVLTIETTLSGLCFYHNYKFSTGDHIAVLVPMNNYKIKENFDEDIALFIKTIWRKNAYKYGYGRPAIIKNIKNTILLLPVDNKGNPDWERMRKYIQYLKSTITFKKIKTSIKKQLNNLIIINSWKEFKLEDYFNVKGSKTTHKVELETTYGIGNYPYITTQATNNGVAGFFDHYTEDGNVLTVDSAVSGYVAYQDTNFTASDHVEILSPKPGVIFDKYIALFIKTIIMKGSYKYDYGRKFNQSRIKDTLLLLPNNNGEPDWEKMRQIIKSLPYSDMI